VKSVYARNVAETALLVFLGFLLLALSFVGIGSRYVLRENEERMERTANEAARLAMAVVQKDELSGWNMSMSLTSLGSVTGSHIFITDTDGTIVSCSDKGMKCEHIGTVLPAELLERVAGDCCCERSDLGGMYPNRRYVLARPVESGGRLLCYVFVTNQADTIFGGWHTFLYVSALIALAVFIVSMLSSMVLSRRMTQPLDEMAAAARKYARGDFSVRVRQAEDPTSEIGALVESFNKMADSLESAERRRSEFIGNISHELRTPMTTIAGFADGILDGTIPPEDERKYLVSIRDETRRLARLVREMLSMSQVNARASDPTRRTVFDLTELVVQTMLSFETRATKKRLDVDPQLPENHLMVRADKDGITQVIYNLMDNAVKFARPGTTIVLRIYKENGKALVSIRDEGETIPPDDLPYIFDRFHKSDRSRSMDKDGVGLGLYLVKSIINSHDEDIAVKSEKGVTEFVFTLPLAEA